MQDENYAEPLFNRLPAAVVALALAIFGVEVLIGLGERGILGGDDGIGWRVATLREFAFFPEALHWMIETGQAPLELLQRFVTYSFVHRSFAHAIFVVVFLLALGKLVGEVFGNLAVLVLFFACGVFGALIFAGLTDGTRPLVGGYPSVYGLIGAYTFLMWVGYGATGENQYRAFTLIGFLLGIQLVFAVLFGASNDWIADLAGFALGFLLTPALAPGAFGRFLDRMRNR